VRSLGALQSRAARSRDGSLVTRLTSTDRSNLRLAVVAFFFALPSMKLPLLNTPQSDFATVLFFPVGIYVLLAMGLNVVVGQAGLLDFGYVAFFAIGAYSMAILGTDIGPGWSFPEILPVAIAIAMVAGVILGTPTLRLRGDYLAIVTLGFGEIVCITAVNTDAIGGPRGISGIPHPPNVAGIRFGLLDPKPYYWLLLTLIIVAILVLRRLEIARALATRPRLLLLDEPSMGLAPKLVAQIFSIISEINQLGTTILLVEQNAAMALQRAHRAYVLETGSIVRSDEAGRLLDDDSVRAAYLGGAVSG
jgi:hypothetical protein